MFHCIDIALLLFTATGSPKPGITEIGLLNTAAVGATLLLAAVTGVGWLRGLVVGVIKAGRLKELQLSGIFAGERDNKASGGWLFEVIDIRVLLDRVRGRSLYVHRTGEEYLFNVTRARLHPNVLLGTWRSLRDSENYGDVLWNADRNGRTILRGCWAGTTRRGKVNFGAWHLTQCSASDSARIRCMLRPSTRQRLSQAFHRLKSRDRAQETTIGDILEKHERDEARIFEHRGDKYTIARGVFNPKFGKVSVALIDIALTQGFHTDVRNVLDWGTGCGFYAIAIASTQEFAASEGHIWALESSAQALACARNNVARFSLSSYITVVDGSNPKIILDDSRPRRFDLILANLPFTIPFSTSKHSSHPMFGSFCTDHRSVLEMAVAFRSHLAPNGRALLAYGDSGDVGWLDTCLRVAGLTRSDIATIDKSQGATDDGMYIFEVRRAAQPSPLEEGGMSLLGSI